MAESEENPETLKYQTLALKVFIHCEGCKKTVKKVLHSIDGVYKICIDSQQQKVVVTGNVEAETLIKKLQKIGKHAELLPDQKKPNEEKAGGGGGGGGGGKKNKSKNKDDNADKPESPNQASSGGADGGSSNASADGGSSNASSSDKPAEGKKSEPAPPEKQDGAGKKTENAPAAGAIAAGGGSGGGNGKKKGNNKGQNNKKNNKGDGDAAAGAEAAPQEANQKPAAVGGGAGIPIPPPAFNLPIYTPQIPSYMLSYNSVQPSLSYGGACYLPTPVHQRGSGAGGIYSAPPGSCYFFSEENANACRIM